MVLRETGLITSISAYCDGEYRIVGPVNAQLGMSGIVRANPDHQAEDVTAMRHHGLQQ